MNNSGKLISETQTEQYTRREAIHDGIEWVSYIPRQRKHATPILMQHGMWHGAWCWQGWQDCLAEWGWESHSISLPGHGKSPMQRPIRLCTLDYYLGFVRGAVDALPQKPILIGHSMGGALTQWYLRDVGNLPAAVLVGAWALYKGFADCGEAFMKLDFMGNLLSIVKVRAEFVRNPQRAGRALLNEQSVMSPEEIYAKLVHESALVLLQNLRPWRLWDNLTTPILWLGAEQDTLIPERASRRAAGIYPTADYVMVKGAAHNIMMEHNYREIAQDIDRWLSAKVSES